MSIEADRNPTSTRSWQSVASEVTTSIAADVREWWRHPKRTAVAATFQLAWIMIVDVVICFGLGELWFRCWYSPADLSADQLGFARKRGPGDQTAWWDDSQRFYHRNTFRALQMQWVWRECPLSLIACVVVSYLCTKIWPRLQARLGWFGRPLVYTIRKILFAPPDHCVRNLSDRKPRWKLRWTLRCWPGIAVHYVIRRVHRCTIPTPYFRGHYRDMTERITWCTINFEIRRPCWISGKLRRGSFTLGTVLRPLRPCPSPAEPGTPLEPLTPLSTMDAMIYDVDPPQLAALEHLEDEKDDLRDALKDCRRDNAGLKRTGAHHEEVISILQQGIISREEETDYCFKKREEERENNARLLKDREELLLLWLGERESLMDYISGTIRNTGHRVTRLLSSITTHDLSTIVNFLRAQEEAIKQRDGDSEPGLATCCASIMAEPAMLTLCASVLAGVQAEKEYLVRFNKALHYQIRSLRRTLFAFRKRAWTVAIVRRVGDMVAGPEPPPLTDFFSIEKGDDTHLVCESAADIPASSSTNFKSYVVDDVFIARSNAIIGEVLTPLIRRADGKHDVCCIADGQSGSGKSYTLFNGPNALAPRIGKDILTRESPYEYRVTCTALEVCQDGLKDLLDAEGSPTTGPPESRSPRGKKPRALENHVSKSITSEAQLCSLLAEACQRRRVSATGANAVSSRGHMICTLTIESASLASPESTRVVIVDLAGSERRQNESLTDDEKAETKFINNSRTEIRRALISLANNEIPAKDSMLTKALGSVLHKGSKFIMLAHLSPFASDYGRSVDTLNFCTEVSNRKSDLSPKEAKTERAEQLPPWYS